MQLTNKQNGSKQFLNISHPANSDSIVKIYSATDPSWAIIEYTNSSKKTNPKSFPLSASPGYFGLLDLRSLEFYTYNKPFKPLKGQICIPVINTASMYALILNGAGLNPLLWYYYHPKKNDVDSIIKWQNANSIVIKNYNSKDIFKKTRESVATILR